MNIEEMKKNIMGSNAFYWVSFNPTKRLEDYAAGFEKECDYIKETCNQYGVDAENFINKYYSLNMSYLCSMSRCASSAVTGGSGFNVARAEKRNKTADNNFEKMVYFYDNLEKKLKRITRPKETQDDKKQAWLDKIEKVKEKHLMMKAFNKDSKKDFDSAYEKLSDELKKEISFQLKIYPNHTPCFAGFQLHYALAEIKRLEGQIVVIDRARENKTDSGFDFDGGKVEFDAEEIRYNIFFDNKPDENTRTRLKSRAFKWSPKRGAWTRGAKSININEIKELLGV